VEDGRVRKIQGDPDHPVTRGFLCYRTSRFLERQYDPERLTTPMIRSGSGHAPIGWDAALDLVAQKLLAVRDESGGAAILNYRCGGSLGLMKHVTDYFFERFGPVTVKSGDICSGPGEAAQARDFGDEESHDLFDLLNSRTIVVWGKNPYISNVHLLPVLREAKSRGARLIQIDPVRHRGADLCEMYLQPRPGGDIALGLALIRRLFDTGATDPGAGEYCDHLEGLRELALSRSIEAWAAIADVAATDVERLAEVYADGPSAILVGWGMQRRTHGAATVRVLDALGAVSGNLGRPGGGVSFYFKRRRAFDTSFSRGLAVAPRSIPEPLLGPGILEAADPPVRMAWISAGNPVAMLPDSNAVARALATREMTVVVDAFMTDTARQAHLVLPTTTMLEEDDLVGSYGHHYLGNVRRVVAPPAGVKSDYEILQALAPRLGLGEEFGRSVREWKQRMRGGLADLGVTLESLEQGAQRSPLVADVLYAERKFPTPSGKVNLIHEVDPEPPRPTPERPLLLMALATEKSQASQMPARRQEGAASVTVHPRAASGFRAGDTVRVESDLGSLTAVLKLDERQRRDVALMDKGGWLHRGRCANALIRARLTDDGEGAAYYDTPVRLLRCE